MRESEQIPIVHESDPSSRKRGRRVGDIAVTVFGFAGLGVVTWERIGTWRYCRTHSGCIDIGGLVAWPVGLLFLAITVYGVRMLILRPRPIRRMRRTP